MPYWPGLHGWHEPPTLWYPAAQSGCVGAGVGAGEGAEVGMENAAGTCEGEADGLVEAVEGVEAEPTDGIAVGDWLGVAEGPATVQAEDPGGDA